MILTFLLIFFLVSFGRAQQCTENDIDSCVEGLLSAVVEDVPEEEICGEMRGAVACLRSTIGRCLAEDDNGEVEEALKELEQLLKKNCETGGNSNDLDENSELEQCFIDNEVYIFECIHVGSSEAFSLMFDKGITDDNAMQCAMYAMMADCYVKRIAERCGEEVSMAAKQDMEALPKEIEEVCDAAGDIDLDFLNISK